jgi:DNA polymerase-4
MALRCCPEAIVIKGNGATYSKYSQLVTEIIQSASPVCEKSSIDEFYLDFSGMDKFFGSLKYARELRERIIRESGLPISFGLSENKTVSKIATGEAKPNNAINVDYGNERSFLAPLSIRKIPFVGLKTYQTFCGLGVKRIHTLQEMPVELVEQVFGKAGRSIWKKANGIDTSPVVQYSERKSISAERTFDQDTIDIYQMETILCAMGEKLAYQLRQKQKVSACVTVKIRYSDFQTKTLQRKIHYTSADHEIIPLIVELFQKIYQRRVRIRLVGVRLSHLVNGGHQLNLFSEDSKYTHLYQAMDNIRNRYGTNIIRYARSK